MRIPKASEFFICGIEHTELRPKEYSWIKDHRLGGIILFKRNIESLQQVVALNSSIIDLNPEFPPLLSVDQEGGRVARLRGICTDLPPMLEFSRTFINDPKFAYRLGAMQGRELVALGFNINFSPVCDILSNDGNDVIGDRAFSKIPEQAALWTSLYIKGLQGAGVAACAKHFPGHGDTVVDSHLALPIIDTTLDELFVRELVPFKAAIEADVATIMTAHIITKPLDELPATLSEKTLVALLRQKLAYKNVIISDDLDMKAVADHYSLQEIIEQAMLASVDLFIIGNNFDKTLQAIDILQHLLDTDERVRAKAIIAAERIDKLRACFLGKPLAPDLHAAQNIVRSKPHLELVGDPR
jgi:beta-N-acetylhexosaminidase